MTIWDQLKPQIGCRYDQLGLTFIAALSNRFTDDAKPG